jgi:amino acid transporter
MEIALFLVVWYSVGFISLFILLYVDSIVQRRPMTYSDLVQAFLWGLMGFVALIVLIVYSLVAAGLAICSLKIWDEPFWQTPLFKKDK